MSWCLATSCNRLHRCMYQNRSQPVHRLILVYPHDWRVNFYSTEKLSAIRCKMHAKSFILRIRYSARGMQQVSPCKHSDAKGMPQVSPCEYSDAKGMIRIWNLCMPHIAGGLRFFKFFDGIKLNSLNLPANCILCYMIVQIACDVEPVASHSKISISTRKYCYGVRLLA